jgi:hypothetical protein
MERKFREKQDARYRMIRFAELGLILFVWVVLLVTPVLFREDNDKPLSRSILNQLEVLVPLSVLYLINRFLLVPRLLFRGRPVGFISAVLGIILFLAFCSYSYDTYVKRYPPPRPEEQLAKTPPPGEQRRNPGQPVPPRSRPAPPFSNFLILSVLVVGFDTGLRSGTRWMIAENEKIKLEKENVAAQLTLLRNQVSPHFFMNTLNNIHALVDSDTGEAKEAIIKLSKMMRYLLYETETEKVTLKKEVEFLQSYIDLMKLRYSGKVTITLNLPAVVPDTMIPPFLFTAFIENAFKHGITYRNDSFVTMDLIPGKDRLAFIIRNSKAEQPGPEEFSGIGLENTRKRLALLYGDRYHLDIIDAGHLFTVTLSVPI